MLSVAKKEAMMMMMNDGEAETMMMINDDEAEMKLDNDEEKTMMTAWLKEELIDGAEIGLRYKLDMVAQPCKRTRHGASETLGDEIGGLQSDAINSDKEQVCKESVDTLEQATQVLSKKDRDIPGAAASLLQIQDKLPMQAKSIISAFLGMNQDSEFEPPEAKAYEAQSGEIIEMLKRLLDEFRTKLFECQKEEMNSKHTYEMVQADLIDSIENSGRNLTEYLMKILALLPLTGWMGLEPLWSECEPRFH